MQLSHKIGQALVLALASLISATLITIAITSSNVIAYYASPASTFWGEFTKSFWWFLWTGLPLIPFAFVPLLVVALIVTWVFSLKPSSTQFWRVFLLQYVITTFIAVISFLILLFRY